MGKPFPWQDIEQSWEPVVRDERFVLYRQKQSVSASDHIVRLIRTDMLKTHPLLTFSAHGTASVPVSVSVSLNNRTVSENIPLSESWQKYHVALPPTAMGNIKGEEIAIDIVSSVSSPHHGEVKEIDFEIASSNYTLNELLDAQFDALHPVKRFRPIPSGLVSQPLAVCQWLLLAVIGLGLAAFLGHVFFFRRPFPLGHGLCL